MSRSQRSMSSQACPSGGDETTGPSPTPEAGCSACAGALTARFSFRRSAGAAVSAGHGSPATLGPPSRVDMERASCASPRLPRLCILHRPPESQHARLRQQVHLPGGAPASRATRTLGRGDPVRERARRPPPSLWPLGTGCATLHLRLTNRTHCARPPPAERREVRGGGDLGDPCVEVRRDRCAG